MLATKEKTSMQITFLKKNTYLTSAALLCGIFLLMGASIASAGAPEMKEVAPLPPQCPDWNGIYMGFNAGVVWDSYDVSDYNGVINLGEQLNSVPQAPEEDENPTDEVALPYFAPFFFSGGSGTDVAPIGGLHVGYKKQFGHFVAGLEFGFEGTQTSKGPGSVRFQENFIDDQGEDTAAAVLSRYDSSRYAERNWDGWVGGQLGYAWCRFYFYGTGGYTFADVGVHTFDRVKSEFFGDSINNEVEPDFDIRKSTVLATVASDVMQGWYAGGGMQYALNNRVTLGLEYRHSDFGNETFRFAGAHPIFPGATNVGLTSNQVEFVVNIMLDHLGQGH
jgi:outer membrane immunogenic protein